MCDDEEKKEKEESEDISQDNEWPKDLGKDQVMYDREGPITENEDN